MLYLIAGEYVKTPNDYSRALQNCARWSGAQYGIRFPVTDVPLPDAG